MSLIPMIDEQLGAKRSWKMKAVFRWVRECSNLMWSWRYKQEFSCFSRKQTKEYFSREFYKFSSYFIELIRSTEFIVWLFFSCRSEVGCSVERRRSSWEKGRSSKKSDPVGLNKDAAAKRESMADNGDLKQFHLH